MEREEIIEGNKLIAEFMGNRRADGMWFFDEPMPFTMADESRLSFNSSWDWLMPCIDKITSMNEYSDFIDHTCSMVSEGGIYINTKFIENTWSDVVEFIKWYNQKK